MSQLPHNRRVNVRGIIYREGKILAVRHRKRDGSSAPYYAIPGGGIDPTESLVDAMRRELMEETAVQAQVGRLLFMQQLQSGRAGFTEELECFFLIENPEDFTSVDLAASTHGAEEIAVCEFVDPAQTTILPKFLTEIDLAHYIDTVRPVLIVDNFGASD